MEEQAPSNFMKERWAASYDPARKVTYVSWFLGTIAYFPSTSKNPACLRIESSPIHPSQWNQKAGELARFLEASS
jgi:hypothetical protein